MSAYRPLGPFPQFLLADGTVNNGGLIHFYQTDLTTLQDTWSDMGLTTLNSNPVVLDASGRPTTDIWGSAAYGVVITDSLGANPRTLNNIQPDVGAGAAIPALVTGDFLTNNGSILLWDGILQVPDPTGFANDVLLTDGTLVFWGPLPVAADPDIAITASSFRAGISTNTSKFFIQTGSGQAPASGTHTTTNAVLFGVAFTTLLGVYISPTSTNVTSAGFNSIPAIAAKNSTGFTAQFDINEASGTFTFVNPVNYDWMAIGFVTV